MKELLQQHIQQTIVDLQKKGKLPAELAYSISIDHTKNKAHGDFATNIALILAKQAQRNPRELAQSIIDHLPEEVLIKKVEIAGPGFINFFLAEGAAQSVVQTILLQGAKYGESSIGHGKKVLLEFVSANPTGPLHVGHGRGAAFGATLARLLRAVGYYVDSEYYVNDAGRQMHILAVSVWLRYLELEGASFEFPKNAYRGEYVYDIAKKLQAREGSRLVFPTDEIFACVSRIPNDEENKETYIDTLIVQVKQLLDGDYPKVFSLALTEILDDIKQDLSEYDVVFQNWFSEQSLMDEGLIDYGIERLSALGFTYEKEGALWFKSTDFGDDKDRVLKRADGRTTYFASDVAYHVNKVERGYDMIIDVFGADHHGYVPRVRAAMRALGINDKNFIIPIVQFAVLYREGKKVQMSTRSGSFVTLRELREEIGKDAARFFYVMRKVEQHMDFDLDLATSKTNENPVFYIQYAHARICSVGRQLREKALVYDQARGLENLSLLSTEHEQSLLKELARYPEVVVQAATYYEPHGVVNYLRELANAFHTYYNAEQFIVSDEKLRNARLCLIMATKQVLVNGLSLLDVSQPEAM